MNVTVCIPYAGTDPARQEALGYVVEHYFDLGWKVCIGEGDPGEWSKADAITDALADATGELLVIADADCWTPRVEKAAWWVAGGHVPWAIPYTSVYRLTQEATAQVLRGEEPTRALPAERQHDAAIGGGIVVLPRALYELAPLDGRFHGWGGEDFAWGYALGCLAGPPGRLSGLCWHLWHPHAYDRNDLHGLCSNAENEALRDRYDAARRDPTEMTELVEEARLWNRTPRSPSSAPPGPGISTATR